MAKLPVVGGETVYVQDAAVSLTGGRWNRCRPRSVIDSQLRRRIPGVKQSTSSALAHITRTHTGRDLGRCYWRRRRLRPRKVPSGVSLIHPRVQARSPAPASPVLGRRRRTPTGRPARGYTRATVVPQGAHGPISGGRGGGGGGVVGGRKLRGLSVLHLRFRDTAAAVAAVVSRSHAVPRRAAALPPIGR